MMNKLWIPALAAACVFSANAFAGHDWDDDDRYEHRHGHRGKHVVMRPVYVESPVVYQAPRVVYPAPQVVYQPVYQPPQVVYRDRIVYRDVPVYEPAPRYYEQPAVQFYPGDRVVAQTVGAIAGGVIGNQFGKGNGRVAATAVGAVVGGIIGGNLPAYRY